MFKSSFRSFNWRQGYNQVPTLWKSININQPPKPIPTQPSQPQPAQPAQPTPTNPNQSFFLAIQHIKRGGLNIQSPLATCAPTLSNIVWLLCCCCLWSGSLVAFGHVVSKLLCLKPFRARKMDHIPSYNRSCHAILWPFLAQTPSFYIWLSCFPRLWPGRSFH